VIVYWGGSFDPVHWGHVRVALEVARQLKPQHLYWVPSAKPPHKTQLWLSGTERVALLNQLVVDLAPESDCPQSVEPLELELPGPSYTLNTLKALRAKQGAEASLVWVIGQDSFLQLDSWWRYRDLLDVAHLLVVPRPGLCHPSDSHLASWWHERVCPLASLALTPAGSFAWLDMPALMISSTYIKFLVQSGASLKGLAPDCVVTALNQAGFYNRDLS
jgi:nicotinate-nucleotide adenylyltransferase